MKKYIKLLCAFLLLLSMVSYLFWPKVQRYRFVTSLFTGVEQMHNFGRMDSFFPNRKVHASDEPLIFPKGTPIDLPTDFKFQNRTTSITEFLEETDTSALVIIHNGEIIYENYWSKGSIDTQWLSMSVAKSYISALIGIALNDGQITSLQDPISDYLPLLTGSAYDGVTIKEVLQMSSGASWNEDYNDPNSDVNRFGRIFAIGGSLGNFTASLEREFPPGTIHRYNSADTQVLGMLLMKVTGKTLSDYMTEKLWKPIGAQNDGYWLIDSDGSEMAFAGFNATALDYAKLGELYRLKGRLNGQQIIPEDWVMQSITPDAPHLMPGTGDLIADFGYGYQWWIPPGNRQEFSAVGVYNQFIFVDPTSHVVLVKLSANRKYGTTRDASAYREGETIEFFRTIVRTLK